jgi:antitoxin component HigA of HigAB toxin-antitoxin module
MTIASDIRAANPGLFEAEALLLEATETICRVMKEQGVTQGMLAKRLGCSKANVSHVLSGNQGMTTKSIARFMCALGKRVTLRVEDIER